MNEFIERLKNVPAEYRSVPFWSWNGELDEQKLCEQIEDMQDKGMGGFIIHARAGLTTEYMGEKWFSCVERCVQEAKKRGMYVWLYDENGWPSGFAGGKLLVNEDFLVSSINYEISEEWNICATATYSYKNGQIKRIYEPIKKGKYIHIFINKNHSYVDLCNPLVTEAFIRETHEVYFEKFGSEFGKTILGFFTDEPQWFRGATPYSSQLIEYFDKKFGEDIFEKLPLLFIDGTGDKEFRFRYYSALNEMICENFFHKIFDWCEQHNCLLTGHGIDERNYVGQMICSGNVMPFYQYMQLPGIDYLGRSYSGSRLARQVYSVAKQTGRKKILTETFAMTGWDVTFDELRCIAESQYVGGANYMCQHLYPYSFKGLGRIDHPCAFSECVSWWERYGEFNEYFARLGYMLAESEERADVAVIHTIKSAYLNWKKEDGYFSIMDEEDNFSSLLKQFFGVGIQFDVADEALMQTLGKIEKGKLVIGNCSYSTVVLPYCTVLNKSTTQLLQEFVRQGGKLFVQDVKPFRVDGGDDFVSFSSNITMSEIIHSSVFAHTRFSSSIISTYRQTKYGNFAYIVNTDSKQGHKIEVFIKGMKCASALDLFSLEKKPVLVKNECAFLDVEAAASIVLLVDFQEGIYEERNIKTVARFKPDYIFPKENYISLDKAEWSLDGQYYLHASVIHKIQEKLLKERYVGDVYLRYCFNVSNSPKAFVVNFDFSAEKVIINNQEVPYVYKDGGTTADLVKCVHYGVNELIIKLNFYQRPYVYEVIFGKDTTESLLNCLYYDTILSEVIISGAFEVETINCLPYGDLYQVQDFIINGKCRKTNHCGNTISNGLPFYRGKLEYFFETDADEGLYKISFNGRYVVARISVNNEDWTSVIFGNSFNCNLKKGKNTIKILIYSGNRNHYGPFHLTKTDDLISPSCFTCKYSDDEVKDFDLEKYYFTKFGLDYVELKKIW